MDELLLIGNREEKEELKKADFDPKTKQMILISCLSALCVGNMMLDAVYAFMPTYIEEKNANNDWAEVNGESSSGVSSF